MTVVSTPELIGRRRRARRRGAGRRRGRARAAPSAGAPRSAAPAGCGSRRQRRAVTITSGERGERDEDRRDPGGEAEALLLGLAEHARAVLRHERGLDLGLRLALVDELGDEGALLVGHVGGGDVQRRPAFQAHDLVLDVGERGARRLGGLRGGRGDGEERARGGRAARASRLLVEDRRERLVDPLLRDREAADGGDPAVAVDDEVLRVARLAPLADEVAVAVAQVGVREAELVDRVERGAGVLLDVDPERPCRPSPPSSRGSSARAGARRRTGRTTRPRCSRARPCPCSRRASRCRPRRGAGSADSTGGEGRSPLATAASSVVSVPVVVRPYASSPTSSAAASVTGQYARGRIPPAMVDAAPVLG